MTAGLVIGQPPQRPGLAAPAPAKQSFSSLTGRPNFAAPPPKVIGTQGLIIGGKGPMPVGMQAAGGMLSAGSGGMQAAAGMLSAGSMQAVGSMQAAGSKASAGFNQNISGGPRP